MKAYLFIETGEVKKPKKGEWVLDLDGEISLGYDNDYEPKFPILTRHEIDIPEGALCLKMWANNGDRYEDKIADIPLTHPKKMVKKWRWLLRKEGRGYFEYCVSSDHKTEKEAYCIWNGKPFWSVVCKVDETMIEVEE